MDRSNQDRRIDAKNVKPGRQPFGTFVRPAIRTRVAASRAHDAHWWSAPNLAWVRWQREDGRYLYTAIRRRRDWLSGEIGISAEPLELDELVLTKNPKSLTLAGSRITLGYLISGHDQWWTTGGNERGFLERLDWLAHQLQLRLHTLNGVRDEDQAA